MYFVAYSGSSMHPTLREPELMEIVPYELKPRHIGDVVLFSSSPCGVGVVHRIVRIGAAGIATRGDNNAHEDEELLQPGNIQGRVVAVWRGQNRRKIRGSLLGRLTAPLLRCRRRLCHGAVFLLHPLYWRLSRGGLLVRVLPASLRPRVVVFQTRGQAEFHLLMGRHTIGRYDGLSHQWRIRRPFHLWADGGALPEPAELRVRRSPPCGGGGHP